MMLIAPNDGDNDDNNVLKMAILCLYSTDTFDAASPCVRFQTIQSMQFGAA